MHPSHAGPDLVLAGTARSGTSSLAAQLGAHPDIDPGKIKEPNYFSRNLHRGADWYEGLYAERQVGKLRLDASTSYTSSEHPGALAELVTAAPDAFVIYATRRPSERALSHYLLRHYYFHNDDAADFGTALRQDTAYTQTSDYSRWIPELERVVALDKLLVVPFEVITRSAAEVTAEICRQLDLAAPPDSSHHGRVHRNDVVQYRSSAARAAARQLRASRAYPWLRNILGPGRTRRFRDVLTRKGELPSVKEAMASCDKAQLTMLQALDERAGAALGAHLAKQDQRLGLNWAGASFASSPPLA